MTKPSTKPRLILFGIDGATFDIIKPAVAAGHLPTISRLLKEGAHGVLKSIIPPVTSPAWTSIMTGVNPGKHGIFEFYTLGEDSYNTRLVSSIDRQTLALWNLLNQQGLRVGVLNVPTTYPPDPIDGWMISGMMGAPTFGKAACFPPELTSDISELGIPYPMERRVRKSARGHYDFAALQQQIDSRTAATLHLLKQRPVDVLIIVCNYTDHVQHDFWHDRSLVTSHGQTIEDMILYAYQQADSFLGRLLDWCGEEATVFVVSDHGAGPLEEYLNLERLLLETGLSVLKPGSVTLNSSGLAFLEHMKKLTPMWLQRLMPLSWYRKTRSFFEERKLDRIDWPRTRVFNIGTYLGLRLNVKGREPQGCITREDYDDQRAEIRSLLENYRHPKTGVPVFEVYPREELYTGPYISEAPDLLGVIGNDKIHLAEFTNPTSTPVFVNWQKMQKMAPAAATGVHRMEGVLIASGPHLHAQRLPTAAQLVDIVPTVLYTLGLPIPSYCDGRVLTEVFADDFVDNHPPRYADIAMQREAEDTEESVYSEQEHEQIKQRLRDLGYLD